MTLDRDDADSLAARLTAPRGNRRETLDVIQTLWAANAHAQHPLHVDPRQHAATLLARFNGATPAPIGVWTPQVDAVGLRWVRDDAAPNAAWWSPTPVLEPKHALLPLRVCLLGESTAAGWFHAPSMTPARMLQHQLDSVRGQGLFEVTDLTMVNLQPTALVQLAAAALQLTPDVLVVFAGNNWPVRLPSFPGVSIGDAREAAAAFAEDGARGLATMADTRTLRSARDTLDTLGHLTAAAGIPLVLVIPEVNMSDWSRRRPVPWLEGDATRRWHAGLGTARAALERGDPGNALETAHAMRGLDQGICATTHELCARALGRLGDARGATGAFRDAVTARAWDNFPSTPSTTAALQQLMSEQGAARDFSVVNLPALFAELNDTAHRGRHLFLDYCHLSIEGMRLAMAGAASAVLDIAGPATLARVSPEHVLAKTSLPVTAPASIARALFMSALYNAHHSPADTVLDDAEAVCRHWLRSAVETWPNIAATLRAYISARAQSPMSFHVSAEQQRFHGALGDLERQSAHTPGLDPDLVNQVQALLGEEDVDAFTEALCAHHADTSADLSHPYYHWRMCERFEGGGGFGQAASGFHAARWPRSDFCLVASAQHDLDLDITARLPGPGGERADDIQIACNGVRVDDIRLGSRWQRLRVRVPRERLQRGINRLGIYWPALSATGNDAVASIREGLEQGIPVDLHPVFGELFRLRVAASRD